MVSPTNPNTKAADLESQLEAKFGKLSLTQTPSEDSSTAAYFYDSPPRTPTVPLTRPVAVAAAAVGRFCGTPRFGDTPSQMAQLTFTAVADPLAELRQGAASAPLKKKVKKDLKASERLYSRLCKTPDADLTPKQRKLMRLTTVLVDALPQVEKTDISSDEAFAIARGLLQARRSHRESAAAAAYVAPPQLAGRELHFEEGRATLVPSPLNARLLRKDTSNKIVRGALSFSLAQVQTAPQMTVHTISSERPMTPFDYIAMQQEVENLAALKGVSHVVQLKGAHEVDNRFSLVFEKFSGDFLELRELIKEGKIDGIDALTFAYGLLCGLESMHKKRIAHLDIKPQNLFWRINDDLTVYAAIGDLGNSVDYSKEKPQQLPACLTKHVYGSVVYSPPEILYGAVSASPSFEESKRMDMWALGLCLYEFFLTKDAPLPPWYGALKAIYESGVRDPRALVPVFKEMYDLIEEQIIAYDAMPWQERTLNDRMTYIILQMIRMNPSERYSATWARMNFAVILKNAKEARTMQTAAAPAAAVKK